MPDNVQRILEKLRGGGYEGYLVGGCVRDCLLGRAPADFDVCTDATPEQMKVCFSGLRLIETGLKHGTVTVLMDGEPVEVTTFRADGAYSDNRHPDSVRFVQNLSEDLARRDFTINAMAYAPIPGLVDPFGGQDDLNAGLVRCVGDARERFREDALRILRALRFASRYGFAVEEKTAAAMREGRALLANISVERILAELKGILVGPGAGELLRGFPEVFFAVLPELAPEYCFEQRNPNHIHDVWTHTSYAVDAIRPDAALRLAMLLHDVGKPEKYFTDEAGTGHFYGHADAGSARADEILRRLKCDNATREEVVLLIAHHDMRPPQTDKGVRRLLSELGLEEFRRLIACWRADLDDRAPEIQERNLRIIGVTEKLLDGILARESCFCLRDLAVNGDDLLSLGVPRGPAVGRALNELLSLVLDGEIQNEREALLARAEKTNAQQ